MDNFDLKKFLVENKLTTNSKLLKEVDTSNWGRELDDYGRSEEDYRPKPSLADFDYDEEAYKKYMEDNFPGELLEEGSNRSDAIVTPTEEKPQTPKETFVELKPEKYQGREIPTQANYRIVYMYSDEPKYEMFTKKEPSDSDMEKFVKIAPEKFEIGDGITALDRNNKQVNYVRLLDNKGFFRRPGDLMPMIM